MGNAVNTELQPPLSAWRLKLLLSSVLVFRSGLFDVTRDDPITVALLKFTIMFHQFPGIMAYGY